MSPSNQRTDSYYGPVTGKRFVLFFSFLLRNNMRYIPEYHVYGLRSNFKGNEFTGGVSAQEAFLFERNEL